MINFIQPSFWLLVLMPAGPDVGFRCSKRMGAAGQFRLGKSSQLHEVSISLTSLRTSRGVDQPTVEVIQ